MANTGPGAPDRSEATEPAESTDAAGKLSPERQALLKRMLEQRRAAEAEQLSFAQERFWFLEQLEPGTAEYHVTVAMRARGSLRFDALQHALRQVAAAHPALRTRFVALGGVPRAQVLEGWTPALATPPRADSLQEIARRTHAQAFDLAAAPPWRVSAFPLGPDEFGLVWTFHHIITDGWSMGLLARDLSLAYNAALRGEDARLTAPSLTYQHLATAERKDLVGAKLETLTSEWRALLQDAPHSTALPADRALPPVLDAAGALRRFELSAAASAGVLRLASQTQSTPYQVLLALLGAFLARTAQAETVVIGTSYAGRDRLGSTEVMGAFVNTLPIPLTLPGATTLDVALQTCQANLRRAIGAGRLPFEKLVSALAPERDARQTPLFNVYFDLVVAPKIPEWEGLDMVHEPVDLGTTAFDLAVSIDPRGARFPVFLQYRTALLDVETIDALGARFDRFCAAWLAQPELALDAVPWFTNGEWARVIKAAQGPDLDADFVPCVERFRHVAARQPAALAVSDGSAQLTYGQLCAHAERLAAALLDAFDALQSAPSGEPNQPRCVLVALPRSAEAIVALLAAHLAGAAYVPLDIDAPANRQALIQAELLGAPTIALVLAGEPARGELATLAVQLDSSGAQLNISLLDSPNVDSLGRNVNADNTTNKPSNSAPKPLPEITPEHIAHILFTSGSTGTPKGVVVPQRALANHATWVAREFRFEPDERFLLRTPLGFDASLWELWPPLLAGAVCVIALGEQGSDAALTLRLAREAGVTVLQTVPSLLRVWLDEPVWRDLHNLRHLIVGGEALSIELAERLRAHLVTDATRCVNLYGPTEACIDATCARVLLPNSVNAGRETVSIGQPLPNTQAVVVDRAGQATPPGVAGELWLAGPQLADGYWRRPEETAARFVFANPFGQAPQGSPSEAQRWYRTGDRVRSFGDGQLEHLGRVDDQVQVRGNRVELGEVERALLAQPQVRQAAVVARADEQTTRLVGFVVLESHAQSQPKAAMQAISNALALELPRYMCPAPLIALDGLPLNANEKIDRIALAARAAHLEFDATPTGRMAQGPIETFLSATLAPWLALDSVPADVDFFQLGGHSLLATRLLAAARKRFDVELTLRAFFEAPTLSALAHTIEHAQSALAIPKRDPRAAVPLSRAQQRLWLAAQQQPDARYNMVGGLWFRGALDAPLLLRSIRDVVERHEVLRAHFPLDSKGEPRQVFDQVIQIREVPSPGEQDAPEERVRALLQAEAEFVFDLARGPLLRMTLVRFHPTCAALLLNMHHLIGDGWSMGVFAEDLSALYAHQILEPLDVQFGDVAVYEQTLQVDQAILDRWVLALGDAPALTEPLALPIDPKAGFRQAQPAPTGAEITRQVPAALAARVATFAEEHKVSAHNVWLTTFSLFLARITRQDDLTLGAVIANRNLPGTEALVGFFVSALPVRLRFAECATFAQALARVRDSMQTLLADAAHPNAPGFDHLVQALETQGRLHHDPQTLPLFQVGFDYAADSALPTFPGVEVEPIEFHSGTAKLDWNVRVEAGSDQCLIRFEYATARYSSALCTALVDAWLAMATALLESDSDRNAPLAWRNAPLATSDMRQAWIATGIGPTALEPRTALETLAHFAATTPTAPALTASTRSAPGMHGHVTYGELAEVAQGLAKTLRRTLATHRDTAAGTDRADHAWPIAIDVPRSFLQVALLFAVWQTGHPWLVLDPAETADRRAAMLQASGASHCLRLAGKGSAPDQVWMRLKNASEELHGLELERLAAPARPPITTARDAYLIATSGTTGAPKWIAIGHAALANQAAGARAKYGLNPNTIALHRIPLTFDAALLELLAPLTAGGQVVLADETAARDPGACANLIAAHNVTLLVGVAAWLEALLQSPTWSAASGSERTLISGGEAMSAGLRANVRSLLQQRIDVQVHNSYGPAEACIEATSHQLSRDESERIPIGTPLPGCEAHVLDTNDQPAPPFVEGELYIGGRGLGRYLNAEHMQRFRPNPLGTASATLYRTGDRAYRDAEGRLYFAGRLDRERKVGGRRFDLFAIERVLADLDGVLHAAVTLDDGVLTAHLVSALDAAPFTVDALSAACRAHLPRGVCPAVWRVHEQLPTFPSGKVDYAKLERTTSGALLQREFAPAASALEQTLIEHFAQHLGGARVGRDTDFFQAGGYSLSAIPLVGDLVQALALPISLATFFAHPTPARLAAAIANPVAIDHASTWQRMRADAELPADWSVAEMSGSEAVFLTGATGFLGAFLIEHLIRTTDKNLICHVRASDPSTGRARIMHNLAKYGFEDQRGAARIEVVCGTLQEPQLGLDDKQWQALRARVGCVVHNGAAVDFFRGYDDLRGANVVGTLGALQLAMESGARLTLVSTIGVAALSEAERASVNEATPLDALIGHTQGYEQTKWVAEALAQAAAARGLNVRVVRPGRVSASRARNAGTTQTDDFAHRFWLGCLQLGAAPDLDAAFDLVPVDEVAAVIVTLLDSDAEPATVHVLNPKPTPYALFFDAARLRGHDVRLIPTAEWVQLLRARREAPLAESAAPALQRLAPILALLDGESSGTEALNPDVALQAIDSHASHQLLARLGLASAPIDELFVNAVLAHFENEGELARP